MLIFLALFILFVLIMNYYIRKNNRLQDNLEKNFWDREHEANFSRKKDISNLNYLIITEDKIPQNLHTDAEKTLLELCNKKMLNLSGKTNTDLKLEYGVANLEELSLCDSRFYDFVCAVSTYAGELLENGQTDAARELLELAVTYHADNSTIYTQLAELYKEKGETGKLPSLIEAAQTLPPMSAQITLEKLKACQS